MAENFPAKTLDSTGQPEMLWSDISEGDTSPYRCFNGTAVHSKQNEFKSLISLDEKVTLEDILTEYTSSVASFPSSFGNTSTASEETLPPPYCVKGWASLQKSGTFPLSRYDMCSTSSERGTSLTKGTSCPLNIR
jgi:hypothetical protein